jgi:hypothetical protein
VKLKWHEKLPQPLQRQWDNLYDQLPAINYISINRRVLVTDTIKIEIHGFCDSSVRVYGACIYLRSANAKNEVTVELLCSKFNVAPIKKLSLQRLELCSALLFVRLYEKEVVALSLKTDSTVLWTDSTLVLTWISYVSSR